MSEAIKNAVPDTVNFIPIQKQVKTLKTNSVGCDSKKQCKMITSIRYQQKCLISGILSAIFICVLIWDKYCRYNRRSLVAKNQNVNLLYVMYEQSCICCDQNWIRTVIYHPALNLYRKITEIFNANKVKGHETSFSHKKKKKNMSLLSCNGLTVRGEIWKHQILLIYEMHKRIILSRLKLTQFIIIWFLRR